MPCRIAYQVLTAAPCYHTQDRNDVAPSEADMHEKQGGKTDRIRGSSSRGIEQVIRVRA
jgi:hypothetical protein